MADANDDATDNSVMDTIPDDGLPPHSPGDDSSFSSNIPNETAENIDGNNSNTGEEEDDDDDEDDNGDEDDNDNEDGNDNDDDNEEDEDLSKTIMNLGGTRKRKSFALLDGVFQDPESGEQERVTIDITRIPALLGRSNESDKGNPHFFGLGKKKALSRKHCTIYYRDREGGRVEWDEMADRVVYKSPSRVAKENDKATNKKQPQPNHSKENTSSSSNKKNNKNNDDGLPSNGFFVIECLGKNRILVDKTRVDQGESMVLRSGSAIRISSYMLYFLLPKDAESKPHKIETPLTEQQKEKAASTIKAAKKKSSGASKPSGSKTNGSKNDPKKTTAPSHKKRPVPTLAASAMKKSRKSGGNSASATLAELEALPVEDLIDRMNEAVTKGIWDRRNQFIGATICYHAVRSAGQAIEIQKKVTQDGGVSRSDIMDWIEQSDQYGSWVQQMLTNMEPRSYQASITKSLLKAGFVRTSGAGRYIKWLTPKDIPLRVKQEPSSSKGGSGRASSESAKKKNKVKKINSVLSSKSGDNDNGDDTGDGDSDSDGDQNQSAESEKGDDDNDNENEEAEAEEEENDDGEDELSASNNNGHEEEDSDDVNEDENEESNSHNNSDDDDHNSEENGNTGDEMSVDNNVDNLSESDPEI
mmetsp:Transcript_2257/g.4835  ORF Transcript_2257/g.4835 Transcript_2257/m.4835 type:complete len:643 (-) Transcript_2257:420-2348(-)|eukprot:CAMPEP_0168168148 /NCGR_PEP_ID=MMETSP0139_2-20121125/2925_1 /TAXON_ID=44445 /ORGANISM="Pseudo-nitzschia australis, Strain 10249 10 AB" /LENGTH=642 /DNA_ID=CAMNT_0008085431 /DNA_START=157 /DNA_END=2085 /DNA_ORIENTATION=-